MNENKLTSIPKPVTYKLLGVILTGSGFFALHQVYQFQRKINNAVATDVLSIDRYRPQYIYIDDPYIQEQLKKGKQMNDERIKLTRLQQWFYDKLKESSFGRNWLSFTKNIAWRYLKLAQSDERSYRLNAVKALANLENLTDSDYQQLAQACDVRTAINLARTEGVDLRFFLDPPYFKLQPDYGAIMKHLHEFVIALDHEAKHPCMQYFISRTFTDVTETEPKTFDDDLGYKIGKTGDIPMCIEAILHHSWIGNNAKSIVTLGGLPLLMEVYKYIVTCTPTNVDLLAKLSNLISNITVFKECLHDFYVTGWIKILAKLMQHEDIRVSVPAARSLLNFDVDSSGPGEGDVKFYRRLFPLYPLTKSYIKPKADIVFIHGLLGGAFITWRQRDFPYPNQKSSFPFLENPSPLESLDVDYDNMNVDMGNENLKRQSLKNEMGKDYEFVLVDIPIDAVNEVDSTFSVSGTHHSSSTFKYDVGASHSKCWPKDWLSKDFPDVRIIGIDYETNISMWSSVCPNLSGRRTLSDRSSHLINVLTSAGVGSRPIIWVAHSMGGLIVKDMLVQAWTSNDENKRKLLQNTKSIVFYSVPHKGSHLAALHPTTQMILWPSVEVQELRENSPYLLQLHSKFLEMVKEYPMRVITFAERESTYITSLKFEMRFVKDESADPDIGEVYGIPLDHLCICKPACRASFIYQKVLDLIQDVLDEVSPDKKSK